jgi:hypothetical protein
MKTKQQINQQIVRDKLWLARHADEDPVIRARYESANQTSFI